MGKNLWPINTHRWLIDVVDEYNIIDVFDYLSMII